MMNRSYLLVVTALLVSLSAFAQNNPDPRKARFVTTDIDNFWRAYDLAQAAPDAAAKAVIYQREYIDKGSDGVKGFMPGRIKSAANLVATIDKHAKFYASIRDTTLHISKLTEQMRRSFSKLKDIYPQAEFPNVYFVIGCLNSGGTTSPNAIIIGAEMNSLAADTPREELSNWLRTNMKSPDGVPYIVAHELIHIQQEYKQPQTLLGKALQEGSADFIGELISGRISNPVQKEYGEKHHSELWPEFSQAMNGKDVSRWLYNGDNSKDRPADLGYYIGYAISRAYYRKAPDKKKAIKEILQLADPAAVLTQSGYAG